MLDSCGYVEKEIQLSNLYRLFQGYFRRLFAFGFLPWKWFWIFYACLMIFFWNFDEKSLMQFLALLMQSLCSSYAVLKLHILLKSHAFLRNGMKEHKDCIRLCLLRVKVWKKFIRRTQEILKKKSWSLDPRSLLKCVKSTNVNVSNEVSFFALWSDTLGSKRTPHHPETCPDETHDKISRHS